MSANPQFQRTDKAIVRALVALLKRKPFEKITIQDILDETPVTRATFYAHFRDKYDIAERMMEQFLTAREESRRERGYILTSFREIQNQALRIDPEFAQALLKIHTDKVDFRRVVGGELEKEYLSTAEGPNRELEARIFAQIYVEMYIYLITTGNDTGGISIFNPVFTAVANRMLQDVREHQGR